MKIMTFIRRCCFATIVGLAAASARGAAVNGYLANPRVFNDNAASALTITPAAPINVNPATITINDQFTGAFTGANRHDVMASINGGGAPAYVHGFDDNFEFTTRLTLTAGFNSPRKEAGIRFNSSITGDLLFLVNSDAGEIVTFGGPFHLFGNNALGNGYTPGTSILLGVRQISGGDGIGGIPNTIEFFIDNGAGLITTGPLAWSNLEGGPVDFQVGVYAQGGANASGDFVNAVFTDTRYLVPEPGTFALVGLGMFGLLAFRRKQ